MSTGGRASGPRHTNPDVSVPSGGSPEVPPARRSTVPHRTDMFTGACPECAGGRRCRQASPICVPDGHRAVPERSRMLARRCCGSAPEDAGAVVVNRFQELIEGRCRRERLVAVELRVPISPERGPCLSAMVLGLPDAPTKSTASADSGRSSSPRSAIWSVCGPSED
jgi:hypothetical protein